MSGPEDCWPISGQPLNQTFPFSFFPSTLTTDGVVVCGPQVALVWVALTAPDLLGASLDDGQATPSARWTDGSTCLGQTATLCDGTSQVLVPTAPGLVYMQRVDENNTPIAASRYRSGSSQRTFALKTTPPNCSVVRLAPFQASIAHALSDASVQAYGARAEADSGREAAVGSCPGLFRQQAPTTEQRVLVRAGQVPTTYKSTRSTLNELVQTSCTSPGWRRVSVPCPWRDLPLDPAGHCHWRPCRLAACVFAPPPLLPVPVCTGRARFTLYRSAGRGGLAARTSRWKRGKRGPNGDAGKRYNRTSRWTLWEYGIIAGVHIRQRTGFQLQRAVQAHGIRPGPGACSGCRRRNRAGSRYCEQTTRDTFNVCAGTVEALLGDAPDAQHALDTSSLPPTLLVQDVVITADATEAPLDEQGALAEGEPPVLPERAVTAGTVRGRRVDGGRWASDDMELDAEEVAARGGRLHLEAIDSQRGVCHMTVSPSCTMHPGAEPVAAHGPAVAHASFIAAGVGGRPRHRPAAGSAAQPEPAGERPPGRGGHRASRGQHELPVERCVPQGINALRGTSYCVNMV